MKKTIDRSVEHWRSFSPTRRIAAVILAALIALSLAYFLFVNFQGNLAFPRLLPRTSIMLGSDLA